MPYKRPAPDKQPAGMIYPYQQLIQLQSAQQTYVPVSCEYHVESSSNHASAKNTIYPLNTSTAISNANNLHHHPNLLYSQTSLNACTFIKYNDYQLTSQSNNNNILHNIYENTILNMNDNNNIFENYNNANNENNNPITSTFFADADAQINFNQITQSTAQQNSIIQSAPSKAIISSPENNMLSKNAAVSNPNSSSDHGGDASENALTVQNAKNLNLPNGHDVSGGYVLGSNSNGIEQELLEESNKSKSIKDSDLANNNAIDSAQINPTTTSVQSAVDESSLNAISFNSATSSSPAASMSAIYTTSSITINNNNSILSRKNSLTTPNQQLINSNSNISGSKAPSSIANNKVDSVPDYVSSLNNPTQAALFSAVLSPYQQFALTPNLYSDPAQLAKEMAQKNYVNALKFAAVAQQQQQPGAKATPQLNPFQAVALPPTNNAHTLLQPGTSSTTPRLPTQLNPSTRAAFLPAAALTRPIQNPFQQFIRPPLQINPLTASTAAQNPYYAAAAAHQQLLNQQNFFYSGLTSPIASPQQYTATSGTSTPSPSHFVSNPFGLGQATAMPTMQVPQIPSQTSPQTGSTSAVVLNPYKKMKTS